MKVVTPTFAKQFACAADNCPDTCCQGWQIVIDPDTLHTYQTMEGAFGDEVRASIVPEAEPYFRFAENGKCALLDESGLCKLQKALGEDAQCRVCRVYPRFVRQYGTLHEEGVSLSCPEALRLLLDAPSPLQFESEEADFPIEPNEIDPDVFFTLQRSRTLAFSLVQDERYSFDDRLFLLVSFAEAVQYCLSCEAYRAFDRVCRRFSSPIGRSAVLRRKKALRYGSAAKWRDLSEWAVFFSWLEILSPQWKTVLAQFSAHCRQETHEHRIVHSGHDAEYASILTATLFKYWLEAADDGILLPKVQQAVVCILLLRELQAMEPGADTIETYHRIARELEHNEENLEAMRRTFLTAPCFSPAAIKRIICM